MLPPRIFTLPDAIVGFTGVDVSTSGVGSSGGAPAGAGASGAPSLTQRPEVAGAEFGGPRGHRPPGKGRPLWTYFLATIRGHQAPSSGRELPPQAQARLFAQNSPPVGLVEDVPA